MKKYSSKFVLFEIQIVLEDQRDWESLIPTDGDENSNTQSLTHTDTLTHTHKHRNTFRSRHRNVHLIHSQKAITSSFYAANEQLREGIRQRPAQQLTTRYRFASTCSDSIKYQSFRHSLLSSLWVPFIIPSCFTIVYMNANTRLENYEECHISRAYK